VTSARLTFAVSKLSVTTSLGASIDVAVLGETVVLGGLVVVAARVAGARALSTLGTCLMRVDPE